MPPQIAAGSSTYAFRQQNSTGSVDAERPNAQSERTDQAQVVLDDLVASGIDLGNSEVGSAPFARLPPPIALHPDHVHPFGMLEHQEAFTLAHVKGLPLPS